MTQAQKAKTQLTNDKAIHYTVRVKKLEQILQITSRKAKAKARGEGWDSKARGEGWD